MPLAPAMGCASAPPPADRRLILEWQEARPAEKTSVQVETLRIFSDGAGNEIELASYTESKRTRGQADSTGHAPQRRCRLQAGDRAKVDGAVGAVKFPTRPTPASLQTGPRERLCARTPNETSPLRCGDVKGSPALVTLLEDLRQTCQNRP
jgi:hypothetical protein